MKHGLKLLYIFIVLTITVVMVTPAYANTGKPSILVSKVQVSPSVFMPGDVGTITITLINPSVSLSGSTLTKVDTYNYGPGTSEGLKTPSYTTQTTTQSNDIPDGSIMLSKVELIADAPIRVISPNQFVDIGRMGMGNSLTFTFIVKADDNATDTTCFSALHVRTDDNGVYLNYPIPVTVDDTPLNISVGDAPESFNSGKQTVTLNVVNDRPDDITDVMVVPSGNNMKFNPQQQYVIGNIDAGDMYTAQFDVALDNASIMGEPSFKAIYKNGNNWHQSELITIRSDQGTVDAAQTDLSGNTLLYPLAFIVVLVLLFGGIFLYMSQKRNKK